MRFALDTFDRPNAATLGTADSGETWQPGGADWGIINHSARKGASPDNVWIPTNATGTYTVALSADPAAVVGNELYGPLSRYVDEDNFILLERVRTGSEDAVKLYVRTGGVWNERDTWVNTGLPALAPIELATVHIGLDLVCYVNGTPQLSYTLTGGEDSALGTGIGIRNEADAAVLFTSIYAASADDRSVRVATAGRSTFMRTMS